MALNALTLGVFLFLQAVPAIAESAVATDDVELTPTFDPKKIISGGRHTCVISAAGTVKCWGSNTNGELGIGSTTSLGLSPDTMGSNLPTLDLGKGVVVKDMCAGEGFSCALTTSGRVKCWGNNNMGQLGQEVAGARVGSAPGQMGDNLPWTNLGTDFVTTDLQCGNSSACAVNTKGQVKCWGRNSQLELGRKIEGRTNLGNKPGDMGNKLPYLPLPPVKSVSMGVYHACAASAEAVYCWGINDYGHSGVEIATTPMELAADAKDARKVKLEDDGVKTTIHAMMAGSETVCAEYSAGTPAKRKVKCWGSNDDGVFGAGIADATVGQKPGTMGSKLPELLLDSSQFIQRELYNFFSCGLKRNGTVQCWGTNDAGQLGLGDNVARGRKPEDMGSNLKHLDLGLPVLALSHGSLANGICALFINHEIKCWGVGNSGQLGYEDNLSRGGNPMDMGDNLPYVRYK